MAPPAIAKIEAGLKAQKKGDALASPKSPNKVTKPVKKPKLEFFSRFPTEIQQMIWSEALQKPACHTFKLVKLKDPATADRYELDLLPLPINIDHSAYRFWKSLLYVRKYKVSDVDLEKALTKEPSNKQKPKAAKPGKPKAEKPELSAADRKKLKIEKQNLRDPDKYIARRSQEAYSKLANLSFQAGFRKSMINLQAVDLRNKRGDWRGAAVDIATDLVIFEFERGETARPNSWFERAGIERVRDKLKPFKRVAVHYKKAHVKADSRGPFQCWCPAGTGFKCKYFKACPMEQACFLDCFTELEAFYYVVDATSKLESNWFDAYRDFARRQGYRLKTSEDPQSARYPLAHFYDQENEYLQLCPRIFLEFQSQKLCELGIYPDVVAEDARLCLMEVLDIYKGKRGNERFVDNLSVRKKVKFGILISYKL